MNPTMKTNQSILKFFTVLLTAAFLISETSHAQVLQRMIERRLSARTPETPKTTVPEYSNLYYWAAHPDKQDYSDSIPAFLKDEQRDSKADVFFIHPTTFTNDLRNAPMNADINDEALNHETDSKTILYQASVFNGSCRVFAPRYRQAHLKAFLMPQSAASKEAFDLAYADVKKAFQYYMDHWNNGRPVIIASHSQGSLHAIRLLQEFFDGKPLQKQLVCAYVVGYQIKKGDFKSLKMGDQPTSIGCVLGWRSYQKGTVERLVGLENGNSLCVNPITWTTTEQWAPKELAKGAIGKDFNVLLPHGVAAGIAPGAKVLWVELPEQAVDKLGRMTNYHILDYNLFYMDIRENVKQRIEAYFKQAH